MSACSQQQTYEGAGFSLRQTCLVQSASGSTFLQGQQVQGRHRLGEALEFEVSDGLDFGEVFDIGVDPLGKQDLAGFCGVAQARGGVLTIRSRGAVQPMNSWTLASSARGETGFEK